MLLRGLLVLVLFWLIARAFWSLVDGVLRGAVGPKPGPGAQRGQTPVSVKMSPCPVCGTFVVPGKAINAVRGGQTVYFCSDACRTRYLAQ